MGHQPSPELLASVQRAFRLMEAAGAHTNGAPEGQLAREAGLEPDTAHHVLRTLARDGYLRKLDDGGYVVGDLLDQLRSGNPGEGRLAGVRPALAKLRDDVSAAAYLTFYEDGEIRVAEIVDGPQTPRVDLWVGFEDAGHATALGKCVLRELDEEARGEYLSRHFLVDLTPRTITHREELVRQLDTLPTPSVMDREEYALGTVCIAVPVYSGDTLGSLGISFRADRMYRTSQVLDMLLSSAGRVSRALSFTR
ncbi:IclR family transcriptional regulator [Streptomyces sp. NBC_00059]|uniref:IclR family transcriptional regulator n=1 Tax=Streptomyces sp. NBC_00059 TaxID=2975635 RepID=UPI00225688CC|nr:IclR family transcriptional regulator C-terminal domain-containing protein [Streptomyces sp. NBC_00059]MCX5411278.1 helix-turn-helix domain-containing protein [Streptomyces sp. NBC_00059]